MIYNIRKIAYKTVNWRLIAIGILFSLFISNNSFGQNYGLQFYSHGVSLDQRTGLDLTPNGPLDIKEDLDLTFYIKFLPQQESYFGYIFRLLLGDNHIDLIHSIISTNPNNFELIIGDKTSRISFHVPLVKLTSEWTKFRFKLDFKEQTISAFINDIMLIDELPNYSAGEGFRLMYGAHSYDHFSSTDLPSIVLRDVQISTKDKLKYSWSLNQTQGNEVISDPPGFNGIVRNPDWVLHKHSFWDKRIELSIQGIVKTAFNPISNEVYLVSSDTLFAFSISNNALQKISFESPFNISSLTEVIYDTISNRLISYSLDTHFKSVFDFQSGSWSHQGPSVGPLTRHWHHNSFSSTDGSIYTFGGYGVFTYRNDILVYREGMSRFDTIKYSGDFYPRYLAGSGYNPMDSLLYFIGGYGSKSGKQAVSPDYYYDIVSYSFTDSSFSQVFEFDEMESGFCFGNSVVFDESNNMYALRFPKHLFTNTLQLVKVPLDDPKIVELGSEIEFSFNDVQSNIDLFFSSITKNLITATSYFTDGKTQVDLYTIEFPPEVALAESSNSNLEHSNRWIWLIPISVILVLIAIFTYRLISKKRSSVLLGSAEVPKVLERKTVSKRHEIPSKPKTNSIILFGGFQVIDKAGVDITGSFSPLLKKLFLYILLSSLRNGKGVSSSILSDTFWFDKSTESARNNRAVNIVKLRTLLESVGKCSITKDTGYWTFVFEPGSVHIDYYEYLNIVRRKSELNKDDICDLLSLIDNGPFLENTNADWLDNYKSEVSNDIIDTLVDYISRSEEDHEFVLHLTNCMFIFDNVSEEAMTVQCQRLVKLGKHSLAKQSYAKFVKEYKQLYDEDYARSFSQVIEEEL